MIVQPRMTTSAWSSLSAVRQAAAASSATAVVSSIMSVTYQSMERTPRQLPAPWIRTRSSSHGRALAWSVTTVNEWPKYEAWFIAASSGPTTGMSTSSRATRTPGS